MKILKQRVITVARLLTALLLGLSSVADKPYGLFYLGAPVLAAGGTTPLLSSHWILLGQAIGSIASGRILYLPPLILLYLIRMIRIKKEPSPILTGLIGAGYESILFFAELSDGYELLLGCCNAVLSACALYFLRLSLRPAPALPERLRFCAKILSTFTILTVCSFPMLDDLPLYFATLLLLLHLGRLNLWRGALGGVLISVTAAWIGGRYNALSVYLSATAAVTVIGKFGKKRYAAAALLCSELALFASGLWVRQLLLFLIPPLAAGIYLLLPDPTPHPPTKQELSLQYQAMVRKVDSLQETASSRIAFYPEIAARASKLLAESGATNVRTTCAKDLLGGFFLDVTFVQGEYPLSPSAVLGLMERAGGFTLAASKYQEREKEIYACFIRRPPLVVRCAALCKTKEGEAVCGDNAIAFGSDQRHYVLLLSDGMGSGKNAFVQSRWTITLLQKLLRAGMSIESAVGMVHSTLKLPQQEVAFATADICSIDLVSGTAQFLKAGAVSTFILRKNRIMEVCGISMPLGATEEPDVVKQTQKLQEGDLILLISDGAFEHKDEILYTLERHRSLPLKELAARLMHAALGEEGQAEDDITVLLAQICKHREENYEHKTQQT